MFAVVVLLTPPVQRPIQALDSEWE
jgi:hypothetical protein